MTVPNKEKEQAEELQQQRQRQQQRQQQRRQALELQQQRQQQQQQQQAEELQQQRQQQQQRCEVVLGCFLVSFSFLLLGLSLALFTFSFLGGPASILYALYFDQQYKTMYREYRRTGQPVDGYVQQVVVYVQKVVASNNSEPGFRRNQATIQYYYYAREQDDTGSYYAFEHTSCIPELVVGQKVSVLVLPDHPQSGRLATGIPKEPSRREIFFLRALWLAIGVGASILVNFVLVSGKWKPLTRYHECNPVWTAAG